MNYTEIRELALEVGDVMTQQYFEQKENISDASELELHKKNNWIVRRLDNFTKEQLLEIAYSAGLMAQENITDVELYSSLLSLRSVCITILELRKSEKITNA